MRPFAPTLACALALVVTACAASGVPRTPVGSAPDGLRLPAAGSSGPEFVGFWESWSDTNRADAFSRLTSVPASVTTTDVAFSIADSNAISPPQNTYPLEPGARRIHAHGDKLLLSFGGATSPFAITDPSLFASNLQAYVSANPKLYDGFDFDDEVIPNNGQQQLIDVLDAVRNAFPNGLVSFDGFIDGADPGPPSGHQGEDVAVIAQAGSAIDYVNVMAYDEYGWVPTNHPDCSYQEGSRDDCRLDVLQQFASIRMDGGRKFPKSKIVLGLMIGQADDGVVVTPRDAAGYARDVERLGYRGVMIWDLDRDNPQAPPGGTGHAKGTYVRAISKALGT
ncbi:MAG: glycosyl hydrolase family 18 protein [Candidatus Baltobacteraceae bacterium]